MFTLVTITDDIPVAPADFGEDYQLQLKRLIQRKYVDRVIPNVGLCIEFYDFLGFHDAIVYPGDGKKDGGEAYHKVDFRLIVFRPVLGEWLVGTITGSTERGIRVSLGFFEEVEVPSSNLRLPYAFVDRHEAWVWQFRDPETKEHMNLFYDKDELVRFRVTSVEFSQGRTPGLEDARKSPMRVVGAMDLDGLGCVSWWPDITDRDDGTEEPQPVADGKP